MCTRDCVRRSALARGWSVAERCSTVLRARGSAALLLLLIVAAPVVADDAPAPLRQTREEADAKSVGCLSCHNGIEPMHEATTVVIGCTDCHGGDSTVNANGATAGSDAYASAQKTAHVQPRHPEAWANPQHPDQISSANPIRSYTLLND